MSATPYKQMEEQPQEESIIESSNRQSVLNVLDQITLAYQMTFQNMLKLEFQKTEEQEFEKNMTLYISWVVCLYEMVKPKISGTEKPEKYDKLKEIMDFENDVVNPEDETTQNTKETLIKAYRNFVGKMRLLRELCEELRYTSDEEGLDREE